MRILRKTLITVLTAALLLSLLGVPTAFAAGATGSDLDFDWIEVSDGFVAITSYTGAGGAVVIPETLSDKIVTQINADAFKDAKATLTSITIPAAVTEIAANLFKDCIALGSVTFATGTQISQIPEGAFAGTALTSVKIPSSVTDIGKDAFKGCAKLASVTFETGNLATIGEGAFFGTKLTSVRIPASVTDIGKDAFSGLTSLTGVTFLSGTVLKTIGEGAFHGTAISSVIIPESVTAIGGNAFSGCASLKKAVVYTDDAVIVTDAFVPAFGFIIYGPTGSTIQTYCNNYADVHPGTTNIVFSSLVTNVGPTTITSAISSGANKISLTWSAAERATSYELYRSTSSSGSWGTPVTTSNTSYIDMSSLVMNTTYYYKVVGYCEIAGSKYYGEYSGVVSVRPVPPAPQSVSAISAGYNSLTIKWTPVPAMSGYKSGYEIYRSDKIDGTYKLVKTWTEAAVSATKVDPKSWVCSGLTTGKTYYFKVRNFQSITTGTGRSAVTTKYYGAYSAVTSGVPMIGRVLDLKYELKSPTSVRISWKAVPGRTKYQLMRKGPSDANFVPYGNPISNTYYTNDRAITCGQTYSYTVYAYRTVSKVKYNGEWATPVDVKFIVKKVTGVKAARYSTGKIKITWSGLTGVDGYEVWRSTSSTTPPEAPGSEYTRVYAGKSKSYYDPVTSGVTYYYWVRAVETSVSPSVYGDWSDYKSASA